MPRPRAAATRPGGPDDTGPVASYKHPATRKNLPPAGLEAQGVLKDAPRLRYEYNPHLPPVLRSAPPAGIPPSGGTGPAKAGTPNLSARETDQLPELLATARQRALSDEEAKVLADALRRQEPWLEWSGKREKPWFEVEPVALHMHERISTQAILRVLAREDVQRDLFADPQHDYAQAVQFYQHDVDWANRMILGDSLQVMASLARREDLAGRVQMIYFDPPYGIKFSSNFQPQLGQRDVKDREQDLTREPEMVKAYRDTWTLGIHSYLAYLRDRLAMARELLADTGSIFVQISDENLHRVRCVMDEVFGVENFCALIGYQKTGGFSTDLLHRNFDYIIWYAKDKPRARFNQIFAFAEPAAEDATFFDSIEKSSGEVEFVSPSNGNRIIMLKDGEILFARNPCNSDGYVGGLSYEFVFEGRKYIPPPTRHWTTVREGMERLAKAGRLILKGNTVRFRRHWRDYPASAIGIYWTDTGTGGFVGDEKLYVVQTDTRAVERCLLMTTDPGDLVLDPTCGSGTTAYVAEQWGRRWITCDTSRVALALAKHRLLTAKFDYYALRPLNAEDLARNPHGTWLAGESSAPRTRVLECASPLALSGRHADPKRQGPAAVQDASRNSHPPTPTPASGVRQSAAAPAEATFHPGKLTFSCRTVPHITLKSIARNTSLDPIFARHEPVLVERLADLNRRLTQINADEGKKLREKLVEKLLQKHREQGANAVTDADTRRWLLPDTHPTLIRIFPPKSPLKGVTPKQAEGYRAAIPKGGWKEWEVPFDTDPDWPKPLQESLTGYRVAWRAKMDEVNACIAANAEVEELVDRPEIVKGVVRVSGPFTLEGVIAVEDGFDTPIGGAPEELGNAEWGMQNEEVQNAEAHLDKVLRLLKASGVDFPATPETPTRNMRFSRLDPLTSASLIHAEGEWINGDRQARRVAVTIGPEVGNVAALQVEDVIRDANRKGYDDVVFAGFGFDAAAQEAIEGGSHPKLRLHMALIRPDVAMGDLLKTQPGSQLFTVFSAPRVKVGPASGSPVGGRQDACSTFVVEVEGMDVYDPVSNQLFPTDKERIAAWFLDTDYDGRTFCICQAFFPDKGKWDKLAKALGGAGVVEEDAFAALSGLTSLPFPRPQRTRPGEPWRVAVKVMDPRGNEGLRVVVMMDPANRSV